MTVLDCHHISEAGNVVLAQDLLRFDFSYLEFIFAIKSAKRVSPT